MPTLTRESSTAIMIQSSTNETAFMEEADINSAQSTTRVLKAEALNISHCELSRERGSGIGDEKLKR